MCRAFESHQACQKTASQSTVFDCGACFCCQPCEENAQVRLESHQACHVGTSYACSDFLCYKNQSPAPLFLLFAKKCRSTRLLACTVLVSLAFADNFFAVTGFASQSTVFDCGACFLLSALRGERTKTGFAIF